MSFLKKIFGLPDKPEGTTEVYQVSKDVIHRYISEIVPTPSFSQLRNQYRTIPNEHLAVLMYSAADTARKLPGNPAMELAAKSCAAYEQGQMIVTESSWSFHLLAREA
jgi:hypothetical protein